MLSRLVRFDGLLIFVTCSTAVPVLESMTVYLCLSQCLSQYVPCISKIITCLMPVSGGGGGGGGGVTAMLKLRDYTA